MRGRRQEREALPKKTEGLENDQESFGNLYYYVLVINV
jgi:hypothetical protein